MFNITIIYIYVVIFVHKFIPWVIQYRFSLLVFSLLILPLSLADLLEINSEKQENYPLSRRQISPRQANRVTRLVGFFGTLIGATLLLLALLGIIFSFTTN